MDMTRKQYPVTVEQLAPRKMGFTISTASVDRDGDTIDPKGWDLKNYERNPVVLWAHDYSQLPVGKAVNIKSTADGLHAEVEFPSPGTYPFADTVHDMVKAGFLNATSVGFKPLEHTESKSRERGLDFSKQELLEFSIVPVPSNPEALAQRGLTPSDMKTYRKALAGWLDETEPKSLKAIRKAGFEAVVTDENDAKLDALEQDFLKESDGGKKELEQDVLETMLEIHGLKQPKNVPVVDVKAIAAEVVALLQAQKMVAPPADNSVEIDIKNTEAEIVWDTIDIAERQPEFDAAIVSQMLLDSVKSSLREMAGAQARAAINHMTGRLD